MKKNNPSTYKNLTFKRMLSSFGMITLVTGFIFSVPSPIVKNELVRSAISKIQEQNERSASRDAGSYLSSSNSSIAYAQDDNYTDDSNNYPEPDNSGGDSGTTNNDDEDDEIYGCTNSSSMAYNSSATVDDGSCTYGGCTNPSALNFSGDADYDDGSCNYSRCQDSTAINQGDAGECKYKDDPRPGCTFPNAENYDAKATEDDGSCSFPIYGCMTPTDKAFDPLATVHSPMRCRGPRDEDKPSVTYCCDGNFRNYTDPGDRQDPHDCEYTESTCNCDSGTNMSASQCGDGDDDLTCNVNVNFSEIKSGVQIGGNADMTKAAPCVDGDDDYLRGAAAAAASPDTPLNTTIALDSFSSFRVTSKDYCLNVAGEQSSASGYNRNDSGFCCEDSTVLNMTGDGCVEGSQIAQCGDATLTPTDSAPSSSLCKNGTPSDVTGTTDSYNWSCTIASANSVSSCSVTKTCAGGSCGQCTFDDCGQDDVCKHIGGLQTSDQLSSLNLTSYNNGECYNSTTGMCGSQVYSPYATTDLTGSSPNLCASGANLSSNPQYNSGTNMWNWTCATTNGGNISPTCSVEKCVGSQCQTQRSTGLIKTFKAEPSIISSPSDRCNLSWTSSVDSNVIDPAQGCRLNDGNVLSNASKLVPPGSYTLMCFVGNQFETKTAKCSVKPDYKEI